MPTSSRTIPLLDQGLTTSRVRPADAIEALAWYLWARALDLALTRAHTVSGVVGEGPPPE